MGIGIENPLLVASRLPVGSRGPIVERLCRVVGIVAPERPRHTRKHRQTSALHFPEADASSVRKRTVCPIHLAAQRGGQLRDFAAAIALKLMCDAETGNAGRLQEYPSPLRAVIKGRDQRLVGSVRESVVFGRPDRVGDRCQVGEALPSRAQGLCVRELVGHGRARIRNHVDAGAGVWGRTFPPRQVGNLDLVAVGVLHDSGVKGTIILQVN